MNTTKAERLKAIIKEHGMTQDALADLLCTTRKTLNAKLNGRSWFTMKEVLDIADLLHLTKDQAADIFLDNLP